MNITAVRASLSSLVAQLEHGELEQVVIVRRGRPVARLVPIASPGKRLGVAKGLLAVPEDIDAQNAVIARQFNGD
ncbi:MAG: type II toxin-antitoxin system prevent-host-death family antitoxin [Rhodocyclaceae bacterium]